MKSGIASRGLAGVFLMDEFNAFVFFGVLFDDLGGIVGGTVIDENDFEALVGLGKDGVEAGGEIFCGVVDRDDDGNFGFGEGGGIGVFWGGTGAAKNETVVKEEVENHDNASGKAKSASGKSELVAKWKVEGLENIVGEFVEWGKETEELSKTWSDGESK